MTAHAYCLEHDQPLEWCQQGTEGVKPHGQGEDMILRLYLEGGAWRELPAAVETDEETGRARIAVDAWPEELAGMRVTGFTLTGIIDPLNPLTLQAGGELVIPLPPATGVRRG